MTDREVMQMALDALKYHTEHTYPFHLTNVAIEALQKVLAQPEQSYQESMYKQIAVVPTKKTLLPTQPEPKSISTNDHLCAMLRQVHDVLACTALPMKRPWVGLTDDNNHFELGLAACVDPRHDPQSFIDGARWAEAKLKEKNT